MTHSISPCEHQKLHWYSHPFNFKAYQQRIGTNMWKGSQSGWSLSIEVPCVYIFDGPRKHMDLLKQLLEVSNNPAEDGLGTTRSKLTVSKRKRG